MSVLYVGDWSVWDCGTCGYTMTSRDAPSADERQCRLCKADVLLADLYRTVRALRQERDDMFVRCAKAERENSEQCDVIFTLQRMIERAHVEPEPPPQSSGKVA